MKRSLLVPVVAVLGALTMLVGTSTSASAATAGVWQYWSNPNTGGTYNTDQFLTVKKSAPTRFFAHQVWFQGTEGAYIGLQQTPAGKIAIFSMWSSPGSAIAGSGATCQTFGGEGVGWSCRMSFNWSVGTKYRLRFWSTAARANKSTQWVGAIQNTSTGVDTIIGYLWSAPGEGQLSGSVSWIEDYGMTTGKCSTETASSAEFSRPTLNNGAYTAAFGSSVTSTCGTHVSGIEKTSTTATLTE